MGRNAGRAPATCAALGAALAAVVATGLLGLGYAQATPQVTAPGVLAAPAQAAPAQAAPARPPQHDDADERGRAADVDDVESSDGDLGADREPGRLRAAAPHTTTSRRTPPPAETSGSAGSQPTGHPAPSAPAVGGPPTVAGTPCTATARACVALGERLAWLLDGGNVVRGPVQIQHGDAQDPTPRGTFKVQWKAEQYTSREYLTQMPYSVFFADGGIAFHQGTQNNPSAGCVKLGREDAEAFFYFLQVDDEVQIH